MPYTHIGNEDYSCIARMLRAGYSYAEIGRTIHKNIGSISRHVRSNGGREHYDTREVKRKKRYTRIEAMDTTRVLQGHLLRSVVSLLKESSSSQNVFTISER